MRLDKSSKNGSMSYFIHNRSKWKETPGIKEKFRKIHIFDNS